MKLSPLQKIIVWRTLGLLLVTVLAAVIFVLYWQINKTRRDIIILQHEMENSLPEAINQATLREQLSDYENKITRVRDLIAQEEQIGRIVSTINQEAEKHKVSVKIPVIEEQVEVDEKGEPVKQTGPLVAVRLEINTLGGSVDLLTFLHAIEHLPWLVAIDSFSFDSNSNYSPPLTARSAPIDQPPGASTPPQKTRNSSLDASLMLLIEKE